MDSNTEVELFDSTDLTTGSKKWREGQYKILLPGRNICYRACKERNSFVS